MRQWYEGLSRRDQMLLLPTVLLVVLALIYMLVWKPIALAGQRLELSNQKSTKALGWMSEAVSELKSRRGGKVASTGGASISALVDATLPAYKLVMKRYQPTSDQGARVWLEDAALPQVIAWLAALERERGMRLRTVSIVASATQGYVKTRVRLEPG